MKNKILLIISFSILLLFPYKVNALSGNLSMQCNSNKIPSGGSTTCSINANVSGIVTTIHAQIKVGNGLSLTNVVTNSAWSGDGEGGTIDLYTDADITGSFNIATFTVSATSTTTGIDSSISLQNVVLSDDNFHEQSFSVSPISIRIPSSINTLSSLSLGGIPINFSSGVTNYNVTTSNSSTTVTATSTDSRASIAGVGTKTLIYGSNTINVIVTAENGAKRTYSIIVTRTDNRSSNNNLSILKLSSGNLKFNANTTQYNVTVANNVSKIDITATLADSKAKFVSGFGPRGINLNTGNNVAYIKVMSENGQVKTYTLNITREYSKSENEDKKPSGGDEQLSNNVNLKDIRLSSGNLKFHKDRTIYVVTVASDITEITIDATLEDSKAKIEGLGKKKLEFGSNEFIIKVTAQDQTVKEYKLKIIKKDETIQDKLSIVEDIVVTGYNINFDSSIHEYVIETNEKKLNIEVFLSNNDYHYEILGNQDLKDGSIIKVVANGKESEEEIYQIKIRHIEEAPVLKKEKDEMNYIPVIMVSLLIGLMLTFIVLIIKRKRKN